MTQNKKVFTHKDKEYAVLRSSPSQENEAQKIYNRAFRDAMESGAYLRKNLNKEMRKHGLWDDDKEKAYQELNKSIQDNLFKLKKGGIKKSEARDLALFIKDQRIILNALLTDTVEMDSHTCEGQAENARFNYLVSQCLVYNDTGEKVYASMEDYLLHANDDLAVEAAVGLSSLLYGLDSNYEINLPENKFLVEYGFMNSDLKLVDKEGNFVSRDGKRVDADGRYIDDNGNYVDRDGRSVDKDGNWLIETEPFLDDDLE